MADIEEFSDSPTVPNAYWIWSVTRAKRNNYMHATRIDPNIQNDELNKVSDENPYPWIMVYVRAIDEPHALKIAYDLFAQYDAEKAGIK